eukprot:5666825-Lingulodinium_polyedra.AAC.1
MPQHANIAAMRAGGVSHETSLEELGLGPLAVCYPGAGVVVVDEAPGQRVSGPLHARYCRCASSGGKKRPDRLES